MIATIAEEFSSDPSDRERSPTIIWKPGFREHPGWKWHLSDNYRCFSQHKIQFDHGFIKQLQKVFFFFSSLNYCNLHG